MKCRLAVYKDSKRQYVQVAGKPETREPMHVLVECGGEIVSETHWPDDDSCYTTIYCTRCGVRYEKLPTLEDEG